MKKEIVKRLTPEDVDGLATQLDNVISTLCAKAHPHTFWYCEECPFHNVCKNVADTIYELECIYEDHI